MSNKVKIYLANFSETDVLVSIGDDTFEVKAKECSYIFRASSPNADLVKIGFKTDKPTISDEREFVVESGGVIRFCEFDGKLRFCEIEKLEPTSLRLVD